MKKSKKKDATATPSIEEQTLKKSPESATNESTTSVPKGAVGSYRVSFEVTLKANSQAEAERMADSKTKKLQKAWGVVAVKQSTVAKES